MGKLFKKMAIIMLPSLFWVGLTALGFGAQSLSNLLELLVILILSILCGFLPERFIKFKYLLIILMCIAFLLRLFMPVIPE